jgi:RND family efflux transporter MFP subunit
MITETKLSAGHLPAPNDRGIQTKLLVAAGLAIAVLGTTWKLYPHGGSSTHAAAAPALPQVVVSKPLVRELDTRLGFLGQFSAVEHVELRAQVGGTLTQVLFKDGDTVHKGDLLFTIDPRPYEIRLAEATAQLEVAKARLDLAERQLDRAKTLESTSAGSVENVDQRTSDLRTAQASVEDAKAQIRDAEFDLDHCRITAPLTGRMGSHFVSVGNLIAGSRTAASPTTLLATLVSLDPIYLDFDMSESDYLEFATYRKHAKGKLAEKIEFALGDERRFTRRGVLDFVDNAVDRSSGTIHARATVPNPDLFLTPGEFARLRLVVSVPESTLLVPDASVLPDQSEHLVMTVSLDGIVGPKKIQLGDIRGGLRVIRSGLTPDDRVIIGGLPYAIPGAKVKTQEGDIRYAADQDPD